MTSPASDWYRNFLNGGPPRRLGEPNRPDLQPVASRPPLEMHLTSREMDVLLELLKDGADNETIARRLGLNIETIKTHMRRVFAKAQVGNRTALVISIWHRDVVVIDNLGRKCEF